MQNRNNTSNSSEFYLHETNLLDENIKKPKRHFKYISNDSNTVKIKYLFLLKNLIFFKSSL